MNRTTFRVGRSACAAPKLALAVFMAAALTFGNVQALESAEVRATAETLLSFPGLRPGLCVFAGADHGELLAELAIAGEYHVHGLTSDRNRLEAMRESVASSGLYGRVVLDHSPLEHLPYASNLINLLVVEDFADAQKNGLTLEEIMRVVAPKSSALLGNAPTDFEQIVTQAGYRDAVIHRKGNWTQIMKPWPEGMDEWPVHHHDSGCSRASRDRSVLPPNSVQWIAGDLWLHEAGPVSVISANGRAFSASFRQGIVARDAFNGLELWQQETAPFGGVVPGCWIAADDQLFTLLESGGPLVALDAGTGKTVRTYDFRPSRIAYDNGVLLAISPDGTAQACDVGSGRKLWSKEIEGLSGRWLDSLNMKGLGPVSTGRTVLGEDKVFLTLPKPRALLCLELKTGKELWRIATKDESLAFYQHGILFSAGRKEKEQVFNAAYSPEDGTRLWRYDYRSVGHGGHPFNVFYLDGLVWVHASVASPNADNGKEEVWHGLNPKSGKVVRRIDWEKTKHRCFADIATEQYIMSGGLDILDVREGDHHKFRATKGSCSVGVRPANGLLYQPPNVCKCFPQVRGFVAFSSDASAANRKDETQDTRRRQTGIGKPADESPSAEDWPMLRHGPARSGSTAVVLPAELKPLWQAEVGGRLSSPVVACGKVFASSIDEHCVFALDIKTGKEVWSYRANGRVDSPPTIYAGRAIFGCRDGWVYCVSSATGELIWSLQAAPRQRWLVCQGQVESAWPLHGSVLVDNDTAYLAAGRHTEVDDGILLFAATPETGKVLWQKQLACSEATEYGAGSAANDILLSDGPAIYMGNSRYDAETGEPRGTWRMAMSGVSDFFWGGPTGLLTDTVKPIAGWHELHWRQWVLSSPLGWPHHSNGLALTFAGQKVFGVRVVGESAWKDAVASYEVFSCSKEEGPKNKTFWQTLLPKGVLPKSILLTGNSVYVAAVNPDDGTSKGSLLVHDPGDGDGLYSIPLDVKPRFDGLAAVKDNLIVVGQDGEIVCLGKK